MEVLDLGAGIVSQMDFRGVAGHTCGVEPDPHVESNPYLDEGKVVFGESLPYPNVNSQPWLKGLRILIIAEMRKTG